MSWRVALAQHPMYLIIKEDSQCAERMPPWGEPTVELYIARVCEGLAALRRYARLRIGYEWSGLELEMLGTEAPDVLKEMLDLAKEGRLTFYNGTYAQPHLQILSSEANYRQFEYGQRIHRELCGHDIHVYQHQESSVHDQVPQLLRAFGIEYATLPNFLSTLVWLDEGELLIRGDHELMFVHGHEFVLWQGLDGSHVNLYLTQPGAAKKRQDWLRQQHVLGLLHAPPIAIVAPDLVAVDEAWLSSFGCAEFVLLDEALAQRVKECPPRARARLYSNWSYIEGIRAEELSRCDRKAETAALRAEALNALAFALLGRKPESTDSIWKTILTAQHHDVYCFSAPELRHKAIGWLQKTEDESSRMADRAAAAIADNIRARREKALPLVVFNTVPHRTLEIVDVDTDVVNPVIEGPRGDHVPAEVIASEDGKQHVRFVADLPGLGYATYGLSEGATGTIEQIADSTITFENRFYRATVYPDATFASLVLTETGDELLDCGGRRGNRLAATDSRGLTPQIPNLHDVHSPRTWQPAHTLPELIWQHSAPTRLRRSPLGLTVIACGRMGDQVSVCVEVALYHVIARIDIAFTFDFGNASIGAFYDDESKLRVCWPLAFPGEIYHDIPFGVVKAQADRPLLPTSWIDVCDGRKGLAYFHRGTPKHWVKDRTLVNLLAWGEDTDVIGGRVSTSTWPKGFDQRLRGRHIIRCAIYPHVGNWQAAGLVHAARSYGMPPVAYFKNNCTGKLAPSVNLLTFEDSNLSATAVKVEEEHVMCRVYAANGRPATTAATTSGLHPGILRLLTGEKVDSLKPFQIGQVGFSVG